MSKDQKEMFGDHFVRDECKPRIDVSSIGGLLKVLLLYSSKSATATGIKEFGLRGWVVPYLRLYGDRLLKDFIQSGGTQGERLHSFAAPSQFNIDSFPPNTFFDSTLDTQILSESGISPVIRRTLDSGRDLFDLRLTAADRVEGQVRMLGVIVQGPVPNRNLAVVHYGSDIRILNNNNPGVLYGSEVLGTWRHTIVVGPQIMDLGGRYNFFQNMSGVRILQPGETDRVKQPSFASMMNYARNLG